MRMENANTYAGNEKSVMNLSSANVMSIYKFKKVQLVIKGGWPISESMIPGCPRGKIITASPQITDAVGFLFHFVSFSAACASQT